MGSLPIVLDDLPTASRWPLPGFCGTGGSPATWVVYPLTTAGRCPNSMVQAVQSPLIDGLPRRNFRKSDSLHFSNFSLTFMLTTSLVN
ncbi:hypothetical protein BHE74_00030278 [Ensete ventricosum]|nr:hypothetical protein BHE74_00030278 [Ensete ventricosum]RZS12433.1 hypothetical protein BHM03_00043878 [Ensete ventricosum]